MEIIMDPSAEPMTSEEIAAIVAEEQGEENPGVLRQLAEGFSAVYSG